MSTRLAGRAAAAPAVVAAAVIAGQIAGLLFAAYLVVAHLAFLRGRVPEPLPAIGAILTGPHTGGWAGWVAGLVVNQLGPSLFWSLVYAWAMVSPRMPRRMGPAVTFGGALGLAAAFVDVFLLVPPVSVVLRGENFWWAAVPWFWSWSAHLLYGLALGWFFVALLPRLEPRLARYRRPPAGLAG